MLLCYLLQSFIWKLFFYTPYIFMCIFLNNFPNAYIQFKVSFTKSQMLYTIDMCLYNQTILYICCFSDFVFKDKSSTAKYSRTNQVQSSIQRPIKYSQVFKDNSSTAKLALVVTSVKQPFVFKARHFHSLLCQILL